MSHQLADAIAQLQRMANHCAWLFQSYRLTTEFRIAYATGVAYPWRLVETHRKADEGVIVRRMHCFSEESALRRSIEERARWKARDRALVAAELPGSRLGISNHEAHDRSKLKAAYDGFDQAVSGLETKRRALRESVCVTKADRVINLKVQNSRSP